MFSNDTPSAILSLALKWRALGMVAVAYARQIVLLKKMRAYSAAAQAELLEAWIYAALVRLSSDIAEGSEQRILSADEQNALSYLKTVHALLSVLALTLSVIRGELARAAQRLAQLAGGFGLSYLTSAPHRLTAAIPYIDSG